MGCGANNLSSYFPREQYNGLDITENAINCLADGATGICASAEDIPLADRSLNIIFEFAFLEHVENPDRVLNEVNRLLKEGSIVCHATAWFCRPFAVAWLLCQPLSQCSIWQRCMRTYYQIRHSLVVRAAIQLPKRLLWELRVLLPGKPGSYVFLPFKGVSDS